MLITGGAVITALFCALFISVFIVEFAPEWMRNILQPVVRFLASVPSVIYGLLGVLVIVPFIGNHLVTEHQKASVAGVISLSGYSLLAAILILDRDDRAADGLDLLRRPARGAPGLARGQPGAGRQPLAHDLEDRRAHGAPGDRRRHRAGRRPRPRRGGDAGDGLRLGRLRAQPGRRR